MDVTELDYELPPELIAQEPAEERDAARLLVLDRDAAAVGHRTVGELPALLPPALFVVNDTRVLPARLLGAKATGGRAELLLLEPVERVEAVTAGADSAALPSAAPRVERWLALGRASKPLRPGTELRFDGGLVARVLSRAPGGQLAVELHGPEPVERLLERVGHVPLPPYIARDDRPEDRERYQTIFAARPGAVAAPTAGLHFSERLVRRLTEQGHRLTEVTLHVGAGTFRPVQVDRLEEHAMHEERYEVSDRAARDIEQARAAGRPVVAVGTTVVRALESALDERGRVRAGPGRTDLFIVPPREVRSVDALLTNFHLPRSTLLALVMAMGGVDAIRGAYREAVRARYRFFSYGDAMLIRGPRAQPAGGAAAAVSEER